jgi:DNA mismatch repair ATPase MutS
MPIAGLVLFTTQLGHAVAAWRHRCGPLVESWTQAVGEMEALASLGGQLFEHPGDTFAEIVEGAVFEAEGATHPLLPESRAVRNDVHLGERRLLLVSGSNMSGKSTLLRTVGTNTVLALAGGPVRARRLRVGPVQLGASIRVQDSLLGGSSRFFAEIQRLRSIMELARERPPLLFLLDEVLGGTNSADRKAGAEAIMRGLLERGAFGLVTTHDLALAESIGPLGPVAANVHFEDQLEEGRLSFDYHLKPGVVTRSNAIALMRAVGLMA